MIEFMVIAAPRSGTTWCSNWLTTDTTLCLHDPINVAHYSDLDNHQTSKRLGISCTGAGYFLDWVNNHPSRKVVLHRDLDEINASMEAIGLPCVPSAYLDRLWAVKGLHVNWLDLFDNPKEIYETLLELPFDSERHALLKATRVNPMFEKVVVDRSVTRRLMNEIFDSLTEVGGQ